MQAGKISAHQIHPGPVLLLAGPGTGKTHTLALRIKWLVENEGVPPEEITVITFTGEAARNMGMRISDPDKKDVFIPPEKRPKQICTMHSLGHQIVAGNLAHTGLRKGFRVITLDKLRNLLIEDAARLAGASDDVAAEVSKRRSHGLSIDAANPLAEVETKYRELMRACNAVDYDEQIMLACKLLREDKGLLENTRAKTKHLLVDEYQDINAAQFEMIRLLSGRQTDGLFVVGDDDQSIYGWRGGSPQFLRNFKKHFGSGAKIESLPVCYRCPPHVLKGATGVVSKFNPDRMPKAVPQSKRQSDTKIICYDVPSQQKEAEIIAAKVAKALPARDVLILVPNRNFASPIQAALRREGISYDSKGSVDIAGFRLVHTLTDWLKQPEDNFALRLCIQAMADCGIGDAPSPRVRDPAKRLERNLLLKNISNLWEDVIQDRITLFESLERRSSSNPFLKAVFSACQKLQQSHDVGLQGFLSSLAELMRPWASSEKFTNEVRTWIEETFGHSGGDSQAVAKILSLQSAKGLEAECVFVVGFDEGVLPNSDAQGDKLEEISRLVYVSLTRATEELHLFHARKREGKISYLLQKTEFGEHTVLKPSRFLIAIPKDNKECIYVQSEQAKREAEKRGRTDADSNSVKALRKH